MEYFVVCESVSIDQLSNRISLLHVLEEFRSREFPTTLPVAVAVAHWMPEAGDLERDFQIQLKIRQAGRADVDFNHNFRFAGPAQRNVLRFEGIPVPGAGELFFDLRLNGELKATHRVLISRID